MTPARILNSLAKHSRDLHHIRYDNKSEKFIELFLTPESVAEIDFQDILCIMDKRAHSLVAFSYAIKFAQLFNSRLNILTQGIHDEMVIDELSKRDIEYQIYSHPEEYYDKVFDIMKDKEIDLVIVNYTNQLHDQLLRVVKCPIMTVRVDQFVKSQNM